MRDLNKMLEAMNGYIHGFIKKSFYPKSLQEEMVIKTYLHQFIKEDPNVFVFSKEASDNVEFIIPLFIKKTCKKYAEKVKIYESFYFNTNDQIPIIDKLIDKILDIFSENIAFYKDDLIENINSSESYSFLSDILEKDLSMLSLKETMSHLKKDNEILTQAKFFLENISSYSLIVSLKRIEILIDELTRSRLTDLVQRKINVLSKTKFGSEKEKNSHQEGLSTFKDQLASTKLFTTEIATLNLREKEENAVLTALLEKIWKKIEYLYRHKKFMVLKETSYCFFNPTYYAENSQNEAVSNKIPSMSNK